MKSSEKVILVENRVGKKYLWRSHPEEPLKKKETRELFRGRILVQKGLKWDSPATINAEGGRSENNEQRDHNTHTPQPKYSFHAMPENKKKE